MQQVHNTEQAVRRLLDEVGNKIVIATPLGVGKPNHFLNKLYQTAKANPEIELTILTALSLNPPKGKTSIEKSFLQPMTERVFGSYPDLEYEIDRTEDRLPNNIEIIEFYFQAGKYKYNGNAQQNYLSSNYTHVVRDIAFRGVNAICQQVVADIDKQNPILSLSCNPDLTIDLDEICKLQKRPLFKVAQINPDLPFMYGESIVGNNFFDVIIDNPKEYFPVFAPPKMSVPDADHMIGLHASTLIKDDGEIQIGIGSLGDALVYSLCLRQNDNKLYQGLLKDLEIDDAFFPLIKKSGDLLPFQKGLFAATEMLCDSFAELYKHKILKKKVFDSVVIQRLLNAERITEDFANDILDELIAERAIHAHLTEKDYLFLKEFGILKENCDWKNQKLILPDGEAILPHLDNQEIHRKIKTQALGSRLRNGAVAHGGFFIGPRNFYQFLKDLPVPERKLFRMKRISQINHLYGHEEIDRLQRTHGRFVNTCMKVTLNGSASSDALENGQQISGVGGQYNFVAMAHELPDAHSILQLRSTRYNRQGKLESNIVFNYGNCTIPRHLRDVVITEYGIAYLRGKTDSEVAAALIKIADSRFQEQLIEQAIVAKKLPANFQLPPRFCKNLPQRYQKVLSNLKEQGLFPAFPFGTDLTDEEIKLGRALKKLQRLQRRRFDIFLHICQSLWQAQPNPSEKKLLERLQLSSPTTWKDWIIRQALVRTLRHP